MDLRGVLDLTWADTLADVAAGGQDLLDGPWAVVHRPCISAADTQRSSGITGERLALILEGLLFCFLSLRLTSVLLSSY